MEKEALQVNSNGKEVKSMANPTLQILQGDCLEVLRTLPDCCVQMCVTSPPYW